MRWTLLLLVAAACLACGQSSSKSDEEQIKESARIYVESLYNGDPRAFYENLDSKTRSLCGYDRIAEVVARFSTTPALVGPIEFDRIEELKVTGNTATAKNFDRVNGS